MYVLLPFSYNSPTQHTHTRLTATQGVCVRWSVWYGYGLHWVGCQYLQATMTNGLGINKRKEWVSISVIGLLYHLHNYVCRESFAIL